MRDWTKSPLPEPGVPGTNRRCRGRCRTGPRMPGTEPGSQRECSARNGGAGDRDRERRGRCGAGPVGPGRGCGWCRECGGWRRPPPRASGAGAGPRAARPAPAAVPPRRRPGAAGGASADRPSMEGTRRALLRLAAACCLLCALPGTGAGRPRGTGAARGRGGRSPPGLAAPGSGRRGSAGTPGLLRPLVGLREEGLGSPPRARKPPGSGASGLVPKLGRSAHGPGRSRPGAAPVRSPGDARRGAGGGGGAEGGRRAPLSRQQRGRPPRPCPYKAAAGSARPAGAAPPPAEPGRVRLPGPAGNPRGCAGRGAASPEALAHPPASGPASPLPPTLQLSGAYEPAAELPTEGTPDKARAPPPACRHWAPSSRRAAGEEAMPVSGTEQEADPGPRQPLPGCISARLHEQHVPTWAGAVCSVALTAPATDNADRALPRGRERAPSRGAVAIPP